MKRPERGAATHATVFAGEIHFIDDHADALESPERITEMREHIRAGDAYIAKSVFTPELVDRLRDYLIQIGRSSLPNYRRIERGCPNFHRLNRWDPRAHVGGCFHQFVFFPWNQDVFDLFDLCAPVYQMKNRLSGLPGDKFLGPDPDEGCIARLAFQFYPRGRGGLNLHSDPVDYHQLTVPVLTMSKKGRDYRAGGAFIEREGGERVALDDVSDPGDVIYFNARCPHGVERIDPDAPLDWLSFEGRWMLLFAINKLADNAKISDSIDLERSGEE